MKVRLRTGVAGAGLAVGPSPPSTAASSGSTSSASEGSLQVAIPFVHTTTLSGATVPARTSDAKASTDTRSEGVSSDDA